MGVRTHRELAAWQLASELRREVVAVTAHPPAASDRRFCDQARAAAASVAANVAEGFARFTPGEFARFLQFSRASLAELDTHIRDAVEREYITNETAAALLRLHARCEHAVAALHADRRRAAAAAKRRPAR
jgi:four helix bundle protein